MNVPASSKFDPKLESLRGLAALAVVIAHSVAVLKVDGIAAHWDLTIGQQTPASLTLLLLSAIFNPGSAVVLFFVLSGFVLALSWTNQGIIVYFIRRLLRLIPPMWTSILTLAIALYTFPPVTSQHLSDWSIHTFKIPSINSLISNLILRDFSVNSVTWTMYVEIVGSAFIPVAMIVRGPLGLVLLLMTAALSWFIYPSLALTYLVCFHLGVLLARREPKIHSFWAWVALIIFIIDRLFFRTGTISLFINCFASYLLIAAVRHGAWSVFLNSKWLRALGRVSFSLYLFHPLVLYFISRYSDYFGTRGVLPHMAVMAIAIPLSVMVAYVAFYLLEKPSITLGKTVAGAIKRRRADSEIAE